MIGSTSKALSSCALLVLWLFTAISSKTLQNSGTRCLGCFAGKHQANSHLQPLPGYRSPCFCSCRPQLGYRTTDNLWVHHTPLAWRSVSQNEGPWYMPGILALAGLAARKQSLNLLSTRNVPGSSYRENINRSEVQCPHIQTDEPWKLLNYFLSNRSPQTPAIGSAIFLRGYRQQIQQIKRLT